MRNFRLILAADDWAHIDYVPLCCTAWRKFFPEMPISLAVLRAELKPFRKYWRAYGKYVDTLHVFNSVEGVAGAPTAKMARLWLACEFGHDVVTLNDIDLVPLQRAWYEHIYAQYVEGHLMLLGEEVYAQAGQDRAPMSALTHISADLKDIVNPDGLEFVDFVRAHRGSGEKTPDNKADVLNAPYFSDEVLFGQMLNIYGKASVPTTHVVRDYDIWGDTADRARWDLLDIEKLNRGEYYEAHLLKYYLPNIKYCDKLYEEWGVIPGLEPIIRYIGYDEPLLRKEPAA